MDLRLIVGSQGLRFGDAALKRNSGNVGQSDALNFSDLFSQAIKLVSPQPQIKISAHAQKRLDERNITMTADLKSSLNSALNELSAKGARDSLVITREAAFLLNVPNRTMITVMRPDEMRNGIVTNIDSVSMKY